MAYSSSHRWRALVGAFLVAMLAASSTLRSAAATPEIPIHVIVSLTGPAAFLGKQEKTALDIGERWLNGHGAQQFRIEYHDDQSKPEIAVQLLTQLASDGVPMVIGPSDRAKCLAINPLLTRGPVAYCLSPTMHADAGSYLFMAGVDTYDLDRALVRYARLRGWKRIGLIASTDATGIDASTAFNAIIKEPENSGMELVAQTHFAPTDISVTAQLAQIKAAQPDVVFAWSTGPAAGTVLQGLMQLGLDVPVATSYGNMSYSSMDSWSAFLPKELDFPASPWSGNAASPGLDPRVRNALRDVHAAFDAAGEKVDSGAATAWDALMITAEVLRKIGPNAGPVQFRDALQRVRGFGGMNGVYDFARNPQRGLGEQSAVIARWSPAKHEWDIVSKSSGIPIDDTRR